MLSFGGICNIWSISGQDLGGAEVGGGVIYIMPPGINYPTTDPQFPHLSRGRLLTDSLDSPKINLVMTMLELDIALRFLRFAATAQTIKLLKNHTDIINEYISTSQNHN